MRPCDVERWLREASALAGELRAETRLMAKVDMSPEAIERRLREVSELTDACERLAEATRAARGPDAPSS